MRNPFARKQEPLRPSSEERLVRRWVETRCQGDPVRADRLERELREEMARAKELRAAQRTAMRGGG